MFNFAARLSGAAMLALAALPMTALATNAVAAPAVKVSDLNVLSTEGEAAFRQRAKVVANQYCSGRMTISARKECRAGVKAEMTEKFASLQAERLAAQSQSFAAR